MYKINTEGCALYLPPSQKNDKFLDIVSVQNKKLDFKEFLLIDTKRKKLKVKGQTKTYISHGKNTLFFALVILRITYLFSCVFEVFISQNAAFQHKEKLS